MPRSRNFAVRSATSAWMTRANAAPSIRVAPSSVVTVPLARSARKIHRPRLTDHDHLDLPRVLQLRFDAPRDLLRQRRHATVVHIVGRHENAHLTACLNCVDLLDAAIARGDPLQPLEALDVRLERFPPCTGSRTRDGVGGLHEHRDLTLMRYVVMV